MKKILDLGCGREKVKVKGAKIIGLDFFSNIFPRIYQRLFCFILPTEIIKFELKVVKNKGL